MKHLNRVVVLIVVVSVFASCKKDRAISPPAIPPPISSNKPPIAKAGNDQTLTYPVTTALLDGGNSSDNDGSISMYLWRQIKGPGQSFISTASKAVTNVNQLIQGVYEFELKVSDNNGLSSKDTVVVTVISTRRLIGLKLIPVGLLSIYRNNVAAATVGNKIFYAGGDNSNIYSRVDIYDIGTQKWSKKELTEPRTMIGAVTVGNKILFAGGASVWEPWDYSTYSTRIDIYDASNELWTTTELPIEMSFRNGKEALITSVGNKVFFCSQWSKDIYIYDVVTNVWSTDQFSNYKTDFAAASLGNIVLISDFSQGQGSNIIDVYNAGTGKWSVTSLSTSRLNIRAATINGKVLFAGGGFFPNFTDVVDIYDVATESWSISKLSQPTALAGIAALDQMWLFFNYGNHVDIYDPISDTWSMADLTESFSDGAVFTTAGGNVYITQGKEVWRVQL